MFYLYGLDHKKHGPFKLGDEFNGGNGKWEAIHESNLKRAETWTHQEFRRPVNFTTSSEEDE